MRRFPDALPLLAGLVPLVTACLLATAVPALDADEMFVDPAQEARARDIGRQLRCLVCQNQSIFDSNAGLAKDLRVVVRERIEAGDSDGEVLDYVRDRFGDYVLLQPRVSAQTWVLWGAPAGFLALGGVIAATYLRRRPTGPAQGLAELSDDDLAEARRLLEGETRA